MPQLEEYLARVGGEVDRALAELLPHPTTGAGRLHEAMRYAVLGGGKRLRPALVAAACEAVGGDREAALPVGCAIEMIHAYSLVHDDLPAMDDDDLRRGRPTVHKAFGEAEAILTGDALLTFAFEVLASYGLRSGLNPGTMLRIVGEVAWGAGPLGMVGGQVEDLAAEGLPGGDAATLEHIHRLKTGALFRAAVRCGALVGGASEADLEAFDSYISHFGLAFQIADDLLDVTGNQAVLGKPIGSDERHGKLTYPALLGLAAARERAESEAAQATQALHRFGERAYMLSALAEFAVRRQH
ncbi:MAG: polyprenyl synthetase family protein [Symbiobacteriia bacterium]